MGFVPVFVDEAYQIITVYIEEAVDIVVTKLSLYV